MVEQEKSLKSLETDVIRAEKPTFNAIILRQLDRVNAAFSRGVIPHESGGWAAMISIDGSLTVLEENLKDYINRKPELREEIDEVKEKVESIPFFVSEAQMWGRRIRLCAKWYGLMVSTLHELGMMPVEEVEALDIDAFEPK